MKMIQCLMNYLNNSTKKQKIKSVRVRYNAVAPNERQVTPDAPTVGTADGTCTDCQEIRRQMLHLGSQCVAVSPALREGFPTARRLANPEGGSRWGKPPRPRQLRPALSSPTQCLPNTLAPVA
ncbi:hypothetical protein SD80_028035 [Scytonema tolypothrichoides VB-61278]|nr:hypothetical protein SD80_028035 [Scytonema tolypothrichoides VB-61278]